jgi:peptidoglycan/LPS O-acetylase OafA/YrhL
MTLKSTKLEYINAVRGIAILMVMMLHVSRAVFKALPGTFSYICSKGAYGVQLFFVASALTLFISYSNRVRSEGNYTNRNFFLRRFFRISPMYYSAAIIYSIIFYYIPRYNDGKPLVIWKVLANIFYVNGVIPGAINYNPPGGWSVGVEMLFYLCLPFLFVRIKNLRSAIGCFLVFSAASIILKLIIRHILISHAIDYKGPETWFLYYWFPNQFPVFFLGIILFFALKKISIKSKSKTYVLFALSSICLAATSYFMPVMDPNFIVPEHIVVALFFSINIFLLAQHPLILFNNQITRFLGEISFSLYLVHFIVVYVLAEYCPLPAEPFTKYFTLLFFTLVISVIISKITYHFIELKGIRFGNNFTKTNLATAKMNFGLGKTATISVNDPSLSKSNVLESENRPEEHALNLDERP